MKHVVLGLLAFGIAMFAVSCSSESTSSALDPANSNKDGNGQITVATTSYLVDYSGSVAEATKAIMDRGGVVSNAFGEISVLVARNLTLANANALAKDPGIVAVIPNEYLEYVPSLDEFMAMATPVAASTAVNYSGDPQDAVFFGNQWNLQRINVAEAWTVTGGDGIRVGILDTGGSPTHIDLTDKYDLSACVNFTTTVEPYDVIDPSDWEDRHFHGTHVAGTVSTNSIGIAGVAPDVTLVAVKVLNDEGWGFFEWIIQGIMYAADPEGGNCDVINLSLGGIAGRAGNGRFLSLVSRAVTYAHRQGCVVVMAAGNNAMDVDHNKNLVVLPVQSGNGIGVSATGPVHDVDPDQTTYYTNYGVSVVSVAAPGGHSNPGPVVNPWRMTDLILSCAAPAVFGDNNLYIHARGTSMACPHVAGAAALVVAAHGGTPKSIEARLQNTATDLGKRGVDPYYGKGLINVGAAVQ